MDFQKLLDTITAATRDTRKNYHVTLGELIEKLRQADPEALIGLHNPHSYRGYYTDLALEPTKAPIKVWQLLNQLTDVLDTELTGYKGGEFLMTYDTPLWVAHYGDTGPAMVDFDPATVTFSLKETH